MSEKMKKIFSREMQNLDAAGLLRIETSAVETDDMKVNFKSNKNYLNFIGNDILGWSTNEIVYDAAAEALAKYGTGSTSPRNSIGTLDIITKLEDKLARFLGLDDCIVFPSNYLANVGLIEPLTNKLDTVFIDEMCNPSLFDSLRLSSANVITYKHEDYDGLEYELKCAQNSRFRIIITDAVFNADGCHTDLRRIQKLKEVYDAITIVDDSFGLGVLGENGKGTFSHLQLEKKPDLMTGTFSHALGNVNGGFVAGNKDLISWIRQTSRTYILSEPLSPINAAIVLKVLEILQQEKFNSKTDADKPDLDNEQSVLGKLYSNSKFIKSEMLDSNWKVKRNDYPFVSINVGSTINAQKMVEALFEQKILVSALCYPNTPEGAALLRINLSANHTKKQISKLIKSITEAFKLIK